ncbi:MAG: hypothetical protein KDA47_04670 [Planctomycetales bacterium]|nr:hypothetical protein [Planctomycetales bacterium]
MAFQFDSELAREMPLAMWRHRKKAVITFVAVLVATMVALAVYPRSFDSESKLFVRLGRESVTLDPTATTGETIPVSESRENEVNSILEVLRSRGLAEKVVDRLGPSVVLGDELEEGGGEPKKPSLLARARAQVGGAVAWAKLWIEPAGPIDDREKAIIELQKLYVERPKKSNIIVVSYQTSSPELAQRIVSTVVDVYRDEHVRINRTPRSYEFFKSQEALLAKQVEERAASLRDAKNSMQLASIDGKRLLIETDIMETTTRLRVLEADLEATQARVDSLDESLVKLPERVTAEEVSGHPNVALDNMRDTLFSLELREKELLAKYQEEHPLVISTRQQLAESRRIVAELPAERTQSTSKINPARESQELKLLDERTKQNALLAEVAELREHQGRLLAELETLNGDEVQLRELQREFDIAETNYRVYQGKLEQARITQAMEADRISNVTVTQEATISRRPASPKKREVAALGLVLAALSSVGVVMLAEASKRTFRTAEQIERMLELPVLIRLPDPNASSAGATRFRLLPR